MYSVEDKVILRAMKSFLIVHALCVVSKNQLCLLIKVN